MNISLTPELEHFVQATVQSGRYRSANEVVHDALRLLKQQESAQTAQMSELRSTIDSGLASLDRGEGVDGESLMQDLIESVEITKAQ